MKYISDDSQIQMHDIRDDPEDGTRLRVVIDPGHGGDDVGAIGASGRYEKDFTLLIAQNVQKLLEAEPLIEVFMTREEDEFLSQTSRFRPQFAIEKEADLFVSIHGNTFDDPTVRGTETYYYHSHSRQFAETIQEYVVNATQFRDRGTKKESFFVLSETEMPAALIEVGYLTNAEEESEMWDNDFQDRVAQAIVEGIKAYAAR